MDNEIKLLALKFDKARQLSGHSKTRYPLNLKMDALELLRKYGELDLISSSLKIHKISLLKWKRNSINKFIPLHIKNTSMSGPTLPQSYPPQTVSIETPKGIKITIHNSPLLIHFITGLEEALPA